MGKMLLLHTTPMYNRGNRALSEECTVIGLIA
jgi:hypothetical protein